MTHSMFASYVLVGMLEIPFLALALFYSLLTGIGFHSIYAASRT